MVILLSYIFVHKILLFQNRTMQFDVFTMYFMAQGADLVAAVRELRKYRAMRPEKLASAGLGSLMEVL